MTTMTGTIKSIWPDRGYGFIRLEGRAGDAFFHKDECTWFGSMSAKDRVQFELTRTAKGLVAKAVQRFLPVDNVQVFAPHQHVFVMTREASPKRGQVSKRVHRTSRCHKSPAAARAELKELAMAYGYNAVLNLRSQRMSVEVGPNYYQTQHQYSGDLAVIGKTRQVSRTDLPKIRKASLPATPPPVAVQPDRLSPEYVVGLLGLAVAFTVAIVFAG